MTSIPSSIGDPGAFICLWKVNACKIYQNKKFDKKGIMTFRLSGSIEDEMWEMKNHETWTIY